MKLLLAEDDHIVRVTVRDALEEAGYQVTDLADGLGALRAAESGSFDIVLTDVRLPGITGIDLFRRIRQLQPRAAVLLMTAYADTDDAVTVIREGARDYIAKPFEMDELLLRLGRVRQELEFRQEMELDRLNTAVPLRRSFRASSPAMRRLLEHIDDAASAGVNVLITGETGCGKDVCARTVHARGARAARPFVAVSCAAIPENLLESELFGHEKGAFTGADRRRVGRFELANHGTLFLDEIGELSPGSQAKLLRAIETQTFEPLGSSRSVSVDVRIIAATNRDLTADIERGSFRKDLFFRLNVIDLHVPPLRERRADIPGLVGDFLAEISARQKRPAPALDPGAVAALATHDYPGNVRELIHALERGVATSRDGVIRVENLPKEMGSAIADDVAATSVLSGGSVESLAIAVEQFEREYIQRVLEKTGGHRGRTAAVLGISRKSLWERLRAGSE